MQETRHAPTPAAATDLALLDARKGRTRAWFEALRDRICVAFEAIEEALPAGAPHGDDPVGRFVRTPWSRADHRGHVGGGGVMSLMKGRIGRASCRERG